MTYRFYGNSLLEWAIVLGITLAIALTGYLVVRMLARRMQDASHPTQGDFAGLAATMAGGTRWWFLIALGFYVGSNWLDLSGREQLFIQRSVIALLIVQVAVWGDRAIRRWMRLSLARSRLENVATATSTAVISFVARTVLWVVALLMALDNMGFNISTLVASLGIGGVAVALAVQSILSDIFASLSIVLDKPFVVGDFIIVGDALGTVEYIGLKTTRIRSLHGEQIVFSNAELLRSRIHNYQRMEERRVAFTFRLSYDSSAKQLRAIPQIVREAIEALEEVRFDRAHFRSYGEWGLDFEAVYYVLTPDYNRMMDCQQSVNLALFERFEQEGIVFALPRRVIEMRDAGQQEAAEPQPGKRFA